MREAQFPPARNFLRAHLPLFHHLPAAEEEVIAADLAEVSAGRSPLTLTAAGVLFFGRGIAYAFDAPDLVALRADLARRWWASLGAQDRDRFRPHVTVQNKVVPEQACALHTERSAAFVPFPAIGTALPPWRYLGGPREPVVAYPFESMPN